MKTQLNFKMADIKGDFNNNQDIQLYYDIDRNCIDYHAPSIGGWFKLSDNQKAIGFLKHINTFGGDKFRWKKQDILEMIQGL